MEGFHFDRTSGCLAISGELTVCQATEARRVLLDALNSDCLRVLDLSGVTELDTAGLQLLLSLQTMPVTAAVHVANPSEPVQSVLALLNLQQRVLGAQGDSRES